MKVARVKQKEEKKVNTESNSYSIKNMIKILITILLVLVVFYFITVLITKNKKEESVESISVIDSSKIILTQLLTQKQEEYYVIATKPSLYKSAYIDINYDSLYNEYIYNYKQKENALMFYYVDLDSALNKKYIGEKSTITDDIENLKITDEVLFKIKDGKIEKYYEGKDNIINKLSKL